jgi:hypothetical protein
VALAGIRYVVVNVKLMKISNIVKSSTSDRWEGASQAGVWFIVERAPGVKSGTADHTIARAVV